MTVSEFTAVADCPKCGHIATHWITDPDILDWEDPWHRVRFKAGFLFGGFRFDDPDSTVARVCRVCEHRWGQK